MKNSDIAIVGGGMVGLAAALALSRYNIKITLIENTEVKGDSHPSYDDRTLVVNRASIRFWTNLGIWQDLSETITPINKVHVSNKGHFGSVHFDAKDYDINALAYIVEAKKLGVKLKQKIQEIENITVICPAQVTDFIEENDTVKIKFIKAGNIQSISCKLMLAADGAQSQIRKKLQLETHIKPYHRTAIICNITPENKHKNCAYERLTNTGPTALLPFVNNRCGFVWTVVEDQATEILGLNDDEFLKQAQLQFGYRLGKFIKVGRRSSYPLYLVTVPQQVKSRTILLGNAAHSMSPISAQGLNLAIRDIASLVDIIVDALENKLDIGSQAVLNDYQHTVENDQNQTIKYTDDLMSWFKINNPIVNNFRSLGLLALDQLPQLKFDLFTRTSGYRDKTAKLLRQQ